MFAAGGRFFPESVSSVLDGLFKHSASSLSSALTVAQSLGLDKWVQIGALSHYSLLSLVSAHQLYRGLTATVPADENVVRAVLQQRESAIASYRKATDEFNSGSYGAAMNRMEIALAEFVDAPLRKYKLAESKIDIALEAEMFQFYGIVLFHYSQDHAFIIKALENLQRASRLDASLVIAHNMMAFIQLYYLDDKDCAHTHLLNSVKLNGQQLFARYYLARLTSDELVMHRVITELMHLSESASDQTSEWRNMQSSTLLFMVPFILADCLSYSAVHMKDARALSKLVEVCSSALSRQPSDLLKMCSMTILEARIHALQRIAKLKRDATIFNTAEMEILAADDFSYDENGNSYFFEVPAGQLYKSVLGSLVDSDDMDFLTTQPYLERMGLMISDWVAHGWLSGDSHSDIQAICALNRKTKHLTSGMRAQAYEEIVRFCQTDTVINHFVATYLSHNWENICRVSSTNPTLSALRFMCDHRGIAFHMYDKQQSRLVRVEDKKIADDDLNMQYSDELHVTYDESTNQFCLLEKLTAPSMVYSRLAMRDYWLLLQKDVNHPEAREVLSRKGAVNLPPLVPVMKTHEDSGFMKVKLPSEGESDFDRGNMANLPDKPSQAGRVSMLTFLSGGALLLAAASATVVLARRMPQ